MGESGEARLAEIVASFLRLGLTAFGGPAAHLLAMKRVFVEQRKWLNHEEFLDLVGACNLLPGPGSTQVAMALGFRRAGWPGLLLAGICFILPASLATLALAWGYVHYGGLAQVQGLLYGAKPVMIAVIVQAVWNLGRTAFRRWPLAVAGAACFAAVLAKMPPIAVLLGAGCVSMLIVWMRRPKLRASRNRQLSLALGALGAGPAISGLGLTSILLTFLKLGVMVFGSGYVLLVFLRAELVERLHWVTGAQLLDAVTAGQVTPGPVFATATFLGYLVHGWSGAAVATLGIFLPSFALAGAVGALAARIRKSALAGAFLDGVNAAAVALMASVALLLGHGTLVNGWTWCIGVASALLLVRFRVNATWLIAGGAVLGVVLRSVS
jgi:chromate transporter